MKKAISKLSKTDLTAKFIGDLMVRLVWHEMYMPVNLATKANDLNKLNIVKVDDREDLPELSLMGHFISDFRSNQIHQTYGIGFKEWLNMPKHITDQILVDAKRAAKESVRMLDDLEKQNSRE